MNNSYEVKNSNLLNGDQRQGIMKDGSGGAETGTWENGKH